MTLNFNIQTWEEFASCLPKNANDTDRLIAAVCYRYEFEKVDETEMSVISSGYFRRARWPHPVNLYATANYCASKGWLSEAGQSNNRKVWRITKRGFESFKNRFKQI
jgi:hypothetical protein